MLRIETANRETPCPQWEGIPPFIARLLLERGVKTQREAEAFLHPSLDQLLPPERLHGLPQAAALLAEARDRKWKTVIYGDYDVDGVSASAILYEAFGLFGLSRSVYIPDRHREGYGLNPEAVEKLAEEYQVLVTVDCGITSVEEVAAAKEKGMRVIVTDHHRHLPDLPPADAVITPLLGDYPFPFLCGAGVAWKLALALIGDGAMALMDIAALATIADMVPLTGENRVIAALGLEKLSQTGRAGLRALMSRAGVREKVTSEQVGFQIAPRMNACGRLESAQTALQMLLARDRDQAEALALKMEGLNQQRRDAEMLVLRQAMEQVQAMNLTETHAIVVLGEDWNSGVVGLAAGRIAEKYAYPTVALARTGDLCVGSARSAGEIDIYAALSQCADLYEKFGGHRQAAGLTLKTERVEEFKARFSAAVARQTGGVPPCPRIVCDGEMSLKDVSVETVNWLSRLEPFGMGNPNPRFLCPEAAPLSLRKVGAEGRHLRCTLSQDGQIREGIYFGGGEWADRTEGSFRVALTPTVNEFHGRVSAECRIYAMQLLPETLRADPAREICALLDEALDGGAAEPLDAEGLDGLMTGGQGTLLVCRCLDTALELHARYADADFALERAEDPRAYHTVLLYGNAKNVRAPFRRIVLCDGDMGEADGFRRACPGAGVYALPRSEALKKLLADAYADVDRLRQCYIALRARPPRDLQDAADRFGMTREMSALALAVFREIGLLNVCFSPFEIAVLPAVRRSPEESALYQAAKRAKEETHGLYSL